MYLATMGRVLTGLEQKIVIDGGEGGDVMKHLPLKDFMKGGGR